METEGRGTEKTVVCKSLLGFEENNEWKERVVAAGGGVSLVMQYKRLQTCSVRRHLSGTSDSFVFHQGDRFTPSSEGWAVFRLDSAPGGLKKPLAATCLDQSWTNPTITAPEGRAGARTMMRAGRVKSAGQMSRGDKIRRLL